VSEQFLAWRKSTRSSGGGNCVEVSISESGDAVGVRDTKNRDGGTLVFPRAAFEGFLAGAREGEFDLS
jgi:hypothetical protein